MSSQTLTSLTEKLPPSYRSVLLDLSRKLTRTQEIQLRFYCTGLITEADSGALGIFGCLENAGKISWEDVSFLKEGLLAVWREDLCKTLTLFEIKRDLIILLDLYARKKCGEESGHAFHSVERVADILVMLTTDDAGIAVESFVESTKNLKKVLIASEEVVERELTDPWSRLTLLIVIAGEIAVVLAKNNNRHKTTEALNLCCKEAAELSSRMINLGSWEEFCDYVEERYNHVYGKNGSSDEASEVGKTAAKVVHKFKETRFFL